WTISSDARLKENIELANLDICFDIVKNLPLKKFKWKDEVYTKEQVPDRNMIGFIADDVELFFKKAVTKRAIHGLEDCRDLDENLIFKAHYGATQQLIKLVENLSQKVEKLEADNETLKTELSELKKLAF
ncbi:MAG: tail fiber domain-containing protein, partial [Bacteroidota bacterium]